MGSLTRGLLLECDFAAQKTNLGSCCPKLTATRNLEAYIRLLREATAMRRLSRDGGGEWPHILSTYEVVIQPICLNESSEANSRTVVLKVDRSSPNGLEERLDRIQF